MLADGRPVNISGAVRSATSPVVTTTHSLESIEQAAPQQVVASHTGSRAELAACLCICERSLYRKIKALDKPWAGNSGKRISRVTPSFKIH